jgi:hypothetical protein
MCTSYRKWETGNSVRPYASGLMLAYLSSTSRMSLSVAYLALSHPGFEVSRIDNQDGFAILEIRNPAP